MAKAEIANDAQFLLWPQKSYLLWRLTFENIISKDEIVDDERMYTFVTMVSPLFQYQFAIFSNRFFTYLP